MPVRLLFVISGILAGGIPGFRMELLLLLSPDVAYWCVCFVLFCVLFWAILRMTHKMSSCMEFQLLVAILSLSSFGWFLFWLFVLVFCFLVLFWFALSLMGLPTGLCIGPLPALLIDGSLSAAVERL